MCVCVCGGGGGSREVMRWGVRGGGEGGIIRLHSLVDQPSLHQ